MTPEARLPHVSLTPPPRESWLLVLGRQANVRTLLVTFLTQAGYTVVECATFPEVEVALKGQDVPGLILFDGEATPEGVLSRQLQQLARLLSSPASCPVLLLSLAQPLPRPKQLPGTVTVLAQPFDLTDLLHLVTATFSPQHDRS
jgi:CheY-like chemotaxis protein